MGCMAHLGRKSLGVKKTDSLTHHCRASGMCGNSEARAFVLLCFWLQSWWHFQVRGVFQHNYLGNYQMLSTSLLCLKERRGGNMGSETALKGRWTGRPIAFSFEGCCDTKDGTV